MGGLAIYIKFSAAFFVIGAALGLALSRFTFRELLRNTQIWVMAIVRALPALIYLVYGIFIRGDLGGQFAGRFHPGLVVEPVSTICSWPAQGLGPRAVVFIALALLGFFLAGKGPLRSLMTGLWISYVAYGLFFDYHVATHDYYHLPLIAIVAVSLSPLGSWFFAVCGIGNCPGSAAKRSVCRPALWFIHQRLDCP